MSIEPGDKRNKDTAWISVTVNVASNDQGVLSKTLSSTSGYLQANGDLDFRSLQMPVIIAFTLGGTSGMTFPDADACIELVKDGGNDSQKTGRDIFKYVAVSDDRLLLVVVDDNPGNSGKWRYTLYAKNAGGAPVAIDPMIINR